MPLLVSRRHCYRKLRETLRNPWDADALIQEAIASSKAETKSVDSQSKASRMVRFSMTVKVNWLYAAEAKHHGDEEEYGVSLFDDGFDFVEEDIAISTHMHLKFWNRVYTIIYISECEGDHLWTVPLARFQPQILFAFHTNTMYSKRALLYRFWIFG